MSSGRRFSLRLSQRPASKQPDLVFADWALVEDDDQDYEPRKRHASSPQHLDAAQAVELQRLHTAQIAEQQRPQQPSPPLVNDDDLERISTAHLAEIARLRDAQAAAYKLLDSVKLSADNRLTELERINAAQAAEIARLQAAQSAAYGLLDAATKRVSVELSPSQPVDRRSSVEQCEQRQCDRQLRQCDRQLRQCNPTDSAFVKTLSIGHRQVNAEHCAPVAGEMGVRPPLF